MGANITGRGYDESTGAIAGGVSLLYKSKNYFGWHIGLNVLGTDEATATALDANNQVQAVRTYMNAVEIFLTGNYYWHLSPRFNLHIGAGPTFYFASTSPLWIWSMRELQPRVITEKEFTELTAGRSVSWVALVENSSCPTQFR